MLANMAAMRTIISFLALILFASGCYTYDVEPRYDARDKFIGYYDAEEYSDTYHVTTYYQLRISKSGYNREIFLNNFYDADLRVFATVHFDEISIPLQVVDGYEIEGSGVLYRDELTLRYSVADLYENTYTDYCETIAWRN